MVCVKIGNLVCALLSVGYAVFAQAADMQLRVVSDRGTPITRIAAGSPCKVELIIPGAVTLRNKPIIPGLDPSQIIREQESMQMQIGNGINRHDRTISYLVSFPEGGRSFSAIISAR
jgi:hypothetical protein